jgi:hypothetical protein
MLFEKRIPEDSEQWETGRFGAQGIEGAMGKLAAHTRSFLVIANFPYVSDIHSPLPRVSHENTCPLPGRWLSATL